MQLNLSILLGAALADSIKPATFAVLITLLTSLKTKDQARIFTNGLAFIAAFFVTSLITGAYFLPTISHLSKTSRTPYLLVGFYALIVGIVELLKHFKPKKSLLSKSIFDPRIRLKAYKDSFLNSSTPAALVGVTVALIELPFSGVIYLATLSTLTTTLPAPNTFILLATYNIILLIPLLIITLSVTRGISTKQFHLWQRSHHNQIHLGIAAILIIMGAWLVSLAN